MRPSFHPRLVNGPFDDPGLYIRFAFDNRAVLFDVGDLSGLSARDILKVTHVFVSHTHMDHFIGFDRLLRIQLGRKERLCLYGPGGFIENVTGKLSGYAWNLIGNYQVPMALDITEVFQDHLRVQHLCSVDRFQTIRPPAVLPFSGTLLAEPGFDIHAAVLDHGIPCLGFSLKERFHVNIIKAAVTDLGLETGSWLRDFKRALYREDTDAAVFTAPGANGRGRQFALDELSRRISKISPGMKIAYIADIGYTPENAEQVIRLASGADHLFIEAAFLEKDRNRAATVHHLTAAQAGQLAGRAGVARLAVFHFSPRYADRPEALIREANAARNRGGRLPSAVNDFGA